MAQNTTSPLTDDQLASFRQALEARRAELTDQLAGLSGELRDVAADDGDEAGGLSNHPADAGSDVMEQERVLTMSADFSESLAQVEAALRRMDDGTYGIDPMTGKAINPERLEAFPWVEYDVESQAAIERGNPPAGHA